MIITMTTVREIADEDYDLWRRSLLSVGYPQDVLDQLIKHDMAVWSQPDLGVETTVSVTREESE